MTKPQPRVDFSQVLQDIAWQIGPEPAPGEARQPAGTRALANYLGVSRGAIRNMLDGTEPRYHEGLWFISVWTHLTGKQEAFLPRRA